MLEKTVTVLEMREWGISTVPPACFLMEIKLKLYIFFLMKRNKPFGPLHPSVPNETHLLEKGTGHSHLVAMATLSHRRNGQVGRIQPHEHGLFLLSLLQPGKPKKAALPPRTYPWCLHLSGSCEMQALLLFMYGEAHKPGNNCHWKSSLLYS